MFSRLSLVEVVLCICVYVSQSVINIFLSFYFKIVGYFNDCLVDDDFAIKNDNDNIMLLSFPA